VASSISATQSHNTLPAGVCARIARCPMPNAGVVSMVVSPAARRRNLLLCAFRSAPSVVQDWPEAGTNCRSSVQLGHVAGGASEGGYCIPQPEQMNAGMVSPFRSLSAVAFAKAQGLTASRKTIISADGFGHSEIENKIRRVKLRDGNTGHGAVPLRQPASDFALRTIGIAPLDMMIVIIASCRGHRASGG
jgi:hypothetical protein